MKRNKPASSSPSKKATGANESSVQTAIVEPSGSSSTSSTSVNGDDQRLTKGKSVATKINNPSNKGYNLANQLYNPESTYQEHLLLIEQQAISQEPEKSQQQQQQQQQQRPSRLEATPTRFAARLSALLSRGPVMVGKSSSGDQADGGEELLKQESARRTVMKMSRNGKSSKNNDNKNGRSGNGAAGGDADPESNLRASGGGGASSRSCTRTRCLQCLLMAVLVASAFLCLLFFLHPKLLQKDQASLCPNDLKTFHQTRNKLFATKTLYSTALNYLSKPPLFSANGNPLMLTYLPPKPTQDPFSNNVTLEQPVPASANYDKSSVSIPSFFHKDSLETLHNTMRNKGCELRQIHFYGRHAARLPSADQIDKIRSTISNIQRRMTLKSQPAAGALDANSQATSDEQTLSSATSMPGGSADSSPADALSPPANCTDKLAGFKEWTMFADPSQGNLLTESGADETMALARRLKDLFPDMLDGRRTNITFGSTGELRTAQTAIEFAKQLTEYRLPSEINCRLDQFPSVNVADKSRAQDIMQDRCLKSFMNKFKRKELSFHDTCEAEYQSQTDRPAPIEKSFGLKSEERTRPMAKSVGELLNVPGLTREDLEAMYDVCRYETALKVSPSIWCSVFSDKDLRFFEYLTDIEDFYGTAYGDKYLTESTCPLFMELLDTTVWDIERTDLTLAPEQRPTQNTVRFHFTHSEVIARLLASLIDLKNDPAYTTRTIEQHLSKGTVPSNRQWQTSLFTPFSANIAFNVYQCPAPPTNPRTIFLDESGVKVITSLNEQPIQLKECKDVVCDLLVLKNRVIHYVSKCDLSQICDKKVVVT